MGKQEIAGNCRLIDAWEVFQFLDAKMPDPEYDTSLTKLFQLRARHQRYVARADQIEESEELTSRQAADGKVVTVVDPRGEKGAKAVPDIRKGVYQIRVTSDMHSTRTILTREYPCWCMFCVSGAYEQCATKCRWVVCDMTPDKRAAGTAMVVDGSEDT